MVEAVDLDNKLFREVSYMKCLNCGCEIDNSMYQTGICFNCGADIADSIEKYNNAIEAEKQK